MTELDMHVEGIYLKVYFDVIKNAVFIRKVLHEGNEINAWPILPDIAKNLTLIGYGDGILFLAQPRPDMPPPRMWN